MKLLWYKTNGSLPLRHLFIAALPTVAYARGTRGSTPPLLTIGKEMKNTLFETIRLISYRDCVFLCFIQLANIISRDLHCDAIIAVVKLFWCVALEPMAGSKCIPGQGQWAPLKLESCRNVIKRLFSTAMAGQDNVWAQRHSWKRMVATQADVPIAMS